MYRNDVISMSFCIGLPNIEMGYLRSSYEWHHIDFPSWHPQLLPASGWITALV